MALTISHGNVYNFEEQRWEMVNNNLEIPTERAGNSAFVWNNAVIIGGGESTAHKVARNEVEAFNTATGLWSNWPALNQGRHGTGFAFIKNHVYTASGCGNRGGEPELTSLERLELPKGHVKSDSKTIDEIPIYKYSHMINCNIEIFIYKSQVNYRLKL